MTYVSKIWLGLKIWLEYKYGARQSHCGVLIPEGSDQHRKTLIVEEVFEVGTLDLRSFQGIVFNIYRTLIFFLDRKIAQVLFGLYQSKT